MNEELIKVATEISGELHRLDEERRRIGLNGFEALERLDPELAAHGRHVWDNDTSGVSEWFTSEIQSLGWKTPWQCLAEGDRENVQRILGSIEYGLPG
jgi:hypothetical protein